MAPSTDTIAKAIRQNIETIARLEEGYNQRRTLSDRIADRIGNFSGSMTFVVVQLLVVGAWIGINSGIVPQIRPWDRFPFMMLAATVSIEAIFLSTFVLIKQSRMSRRADERAHLDLQINLLAEREMTLMLQMLQAVCEHLGVRASHEHLEELSEETPVEAVANELQKAMAEEQPTS